MPQKTRFTIYDAMEGRGVFSSNPANPGSRDNDGNDLYTGPVPFPKMVYHPEGEERITTPAEMVLRAGQYVPVGEQRELINKTVNNQAEFDAAIAEGWHDHPAKAVEARVNGLIEAGNLTEKEIKALLASIPKLSPSVNRIKELEAEIARLTATKATKPLDDDDEEAA